MKKQPLHAFVPTPDFFVLYHSDVNFLHHFTYISPTSWMSSSVHDMLVQLICGKKPNFHTSSRAAGLQAVNRGKPHAGASAPSKRLQWRVPENITQSYSQLYICTHTSYYIYPEWSKTLWDTSQPHNITSCPPHFSPQWMYWFIALQFPLSWTMWWAHKVS